MAARGCEKRWIRQTFSAKPRLRFRAFLRLVCWGDHFPTQGAEEVPCAWVDVENGRALLAAASRHGGCRSFREIGRDMRQVWHECGICQYPLRGCAPGQEGRETGFRPACLGLF